VKNVARGLLILLLLLLVACPENPPVPPSGFNIELRFLPGFPDQYKPLVEAQTRYWEQIIVGDISDTTGSFDPAACGFTNEQTPTPLSILTQVDDVILYVGLFTTAQSSLGGVVATGGPCLVRSSTHLPIVAKMVFDPLDLPGATATPAQLSLFNDIAIHELGHALGSGTIWDQFPGLYIKTPDGTPCGSNPEFTGINAKREYEALGGTGNVPLKTSSEDGSCGHWSERLFFRELMTPAVNSNTAPSGKNNLLSRLTIASMQDLGYTVDYGVADNYSLSVAEVNGTFNIEWIYSKDFPDSLKPSFDAAIGRWESIITADVLNTSGVFKPAAGDCNIANEPPFSGVDDIIIYVGIIPDAQNAGANGLKYRAEPCKTRAGSFLPEIAVIQYSSDKLPGAFQNPNSFLNPTTLNFTKSIARALGFGTNWLKKGLITGSLGDGLCSPSSEYTGNNAVREAQALGGIGNIIFRDQIYYTPNVPSVKCAEGWNVNRYYKELMGGGQSYINGSTTTPPAISKVTIGAMQDLGYTVNYGVADPLSLPPQILVDPCPNGCT
jgi:Leishmanolysin